MTDGVDAATAAALPSVYWGFFTGSRLAAAVITSPTRWRVKSANLLSISSVGALLALGVVQVGSNTVHGGGSIATMWVGTAIFGVFQGPMWPAMESLLSEEFGVHLRTVDAVIILVVSNCGRAAQQLLFSWLLSRGATVRAKG